MNYEEEVKIVHPKAFITTIQIDYDVIEPNGVGSFNFLGGNTTNEESAWK
jgi:hypothetical protein